jgi:hypothetical protein
VSGVVGEDPTSAGCGATSNDYAGWRPVPSPGGKRPSPDRGKSCRRQRPTASGPVSERTPAPLRLARYEAAVVGQMNVLQFAKNVRESSEIISVADQIVPSAAATEAL